jgi:hypothetical protein
MGESAAVSASADGETSEAATTARNKTNNGDGPPVIAIAQDGDIILDLTFETSKETLQRSRKEALAAARKAGAGAGSSSSSSGSGSHGRASNGTANGVANANGTPQPLITPAAAAATAASLKPRVRVAYRVSLVALNKGSRYFANLLGNVRFREAKAIADAHERLSSAGVKPSEAPAGDLPWITITDDDEATRTAGREHAFEDMLRVIHQLPPRTLAAASATTTTRTAAATTMSHVATLAVLADRFDCAPAVSRSLGQDVKLRWPATSSRPMHDERGRPTATEQVLRQKVLVAWLLGQPMRLHQASRELIIRGSRRWGAFSMDDGEGGEGDGEEEEDSGMTTAWWNLPDGLEGRSFLLLSHVPNHRVMCLIWKGIRYQVYEC